MVNRILALVAITAALSFGQQLDSNSVTVTASRSTNLPSDEAVFAVYVNSDYKAGLSDVLAALQGSGITAANFSGVNAAQTFQPPSGTPLQPMLEWAFRLPVALSKIKDTVAALTALQQSVMQKNNGLTVSFTVQGTQVSTQLQQSQPCAVSDLLSDARVKAQKLADAAGLSVGTVLAMSSQTTSTAPNGVAASFPFPPICALTVKFALGRF
ncbi:MAG: hypothetical protein ACR2NN_26535 [Bryobacteraceae bacterium]